MAKSGFIKTAIFPLLLGLLASICHAQVEMREPPPRRSKFSKFYITADDVDYNMKSPLGGKIGYPCRNTSSGPVQGTLVAGQDLKVFFDGTATRQGGDCQFAISYDNGTNFAVIWDKLGNCFLDTVNGGYEVPVPDRLPATKSAVLAWTWIPSIGNRAYYMNCADVRVENYGKQESYIGKELLVVNVPGKPNLSPAKSDKHDLLSSMLDARPLITVGEPVQPSEPTNTPADADGNTNEDDGDSKVDDQNNDDSKPSDDNDNGDAGTVVLYVSESTMTSTNIVYVTEFLTEDDTNVNALYTYGAGIQTKGQLSTTLGPYIKPLFGTNVGLTIESDSFEAAAASSTETASHLSFTDDLAGWPTGSARLSGSESLDLIPPSLALPHTTSLSDSVDILISGSSTAHSGGSNTLESAYHAGTPLFSTSRQYDLAESKATDSSLDPTMLPGLTSANAVTTNRPLYKSVTDKASKGMLNHYHPSITAPTPHATTIFSTATKDGKPVLQVVVSMDTSKVPESLTISY
ncbi:hypothetical protein GGI25_001582 [Coemansia spiralis]|uniref:Lytic polysaccharide monooxygenase n=2 Tax=Coemansia TaxID=4863 RepID=A0A9W8KZF0_9FUNG|nr:hypothetical protein BX070DRAFT_227108 [Coemansia spiralis]KAJ1993691.1 hypothetical protein EDC05_002084 [Coemansia umbellata]KAJ2622942.1 hypothetical protein GGI26_002743 [Coemansia sp. RSA 1358]KAJ2679447.1 hypothetical protein GGI25_001582 [Coemansia spiralis]